MAGKKYTTKTQCIIEGCLTLGTRPLGMCLKHWTRWERHADPFWKDHKVITRPVGETAEERFWSRVDKSEGQGPKGDCWEWVGMPSHRYGSFTFKGVKHAAHRFALELKLGEPLGDGLFACHTCDNTRCCRPEHLFAGTAEDNTKDMWAKGRANPIRPYMPAKGAKVRTAKLTDEQVIELRQRRKNREKLSDLADVYGITVSQVWRISSGGAWTHLEV